MPGSDDVVLVRNRVPGSGPWCGLNHGPLRDAGDVFGSVYS